MSAGSPGGSLTDIESSYSSRAASGTTTGNQVLSPQQLGVMGMEKLDTVINYWEDALAAHSLGNAQPEDAEFFREIRNLLELAYTLQEQSEVLFLDERSCLFRTQNEESSQDPNNFDSDSFASALDQIADLREFEDFETEEINENLENPLFQSTVKQMEEHQIPCRVSVCVQKMSINVKAGMIGSFHVSLEWRRGPLKTDRLRACSAFN